jgi:hypothetical protein
MDAEERRLSLRNVALIDAAELAGQPGLPGIGHELAEPRPARMLDRQQSWDAGKASTPAKRVSRSLLRETVLAVHRAHPDGLTDSELSGLIPGAHPGSVSKRRHDCMAAGLVRETDLTRATAYGAQATVWVVV